MNLNKEPGWACDVCRSPLRVMAEPYIDRDTGEEYVGLISLCEDCVRDERTAAEDAGYDTGYDDGYADGENKPEDRVFQVMRRILDAVEDGEKPDQYYLTLLKELL
jgi:hypothetical protein